MGGFYGGPNYSCPIGTLLARQSLLCDQGGGLERLKLCHRETLVHRSGARAAEDQRRRRERGCRAEERQTGIERELKLAWTATSQYAIVSQTVKVDGKTIAARINNPQHGLNYNCIIGAFSVGTHKYTIRTTDAKGVSSSVSGTFDVQAPVPPAIAAATVVEAADPTSGKLEPSQKLKITWTASSQYRIASQIVWIDGKKITKPIQHAGGTSYSCVIGAYRPASTSIRSNRPMRRASVPSAPARYRGRPR